MSAQAGPSKKRPVIVEEDATKLQFGEFADGEALTVMEVQLLLAATRNAPGAPKAPDNKVYKLTSEYVSEFSNAASDVVDSMRTALMAHTQFLNKFEVAQILYLRPESVEVAVALIPSLDRHMGQDDTTETLSQILEDVRGIARYGGRP
ncbi:HRDC-like protein [Dioszegia hungarica]|uniref:HRDC-like protein n=1 Tax=Dioszegia hungarica TaxID=4972 RepID=A0AA38H9V4_9TREE|nr:HRDC-like protein [Dioszegia hungarica]KAI9637157.1 HRDC-like protein [Dioszegia hungarica]